ncbi:MAG: transporter substrate-binding domain-containing protein [Desulfobacterales bacterium]|nr:transporter substrate-binding domain-containing protein [Desulfobacterales bacterium]
MKKIVTLILAASIAITIIGCNEKNTETINSVSNLKGKVIGMNQFGASKESVISSMSKQFGGKPKDVMMFENISDAILSLLGDKIDAIQLFKFTADYYSNKNSKLKVLQQEQPNIGKAFLVVRREDQKLKKDLDNAITTLQENGILKTLEDLWIKNFPLTNEPTNKEISEIKGVKTFYVSVNGQDPPLDYIASNGKTAGYSVALFAELGKILNVNFKFVPLVGNANYISLSSKKTDIIFFDVEFSGSIDDNLDDEPSDSSWVATKPILESVSKCYLVKK